MSTHPIIRLFSKLAIPFIMLFGLYVQFHGDFGPGGGFQAGVIFAAAFVLYALLYGMEEARKVVSMEWVRILVAAGVLLYAGVGLVSVMLGGNYLDYNVLAHDPVHGQHYGILLVELGVGITVAAAMITILMMSGFYIVITRGNLVKKIIGLNIFQTSVFIFYISMGKVEGGTAPILAEGISNFSNPLPHVLILTAIVVGVATSALALALVVRIKRAYGSIEEDEIYRQEEDDDQ